ncbi:MAG: hypothetical protein KJ734_04820, partial [Chloroflexi bacterium]|nr:hypothetical protein [Chloroflexota bacterium]
QPMTPYLWTLLRVFAGGLLILLGILVAFRVFQPYAFQGPGLFNIQPNEQFFNDMGSIRGLMNGDVDYPPSHQWTNRTPLLFPLENMVLWGLGVPLGVAACAGWGLALAQLIWRRRWEHLLPLVWVTTTFLYIGTQFVKSVRYFLPIYPFLALLAAFLVVAVWDWARGKVHHTSSVTRIAYSALAIGVALFVTVGTLAWAWSFIQIYARPVTRITASRWIYDNWQSGATIHTADGQSILVPIQNGYVYGLDDDMNATAFTPRSDVTAVAVTMNHLEDVNGDPDPERFQVTIAVTPDGQAALAQAEQTVELASSQPHGVAVTFQLAPTSLQGGQTYYLVTRAVAGAPIRSWGDTIGNEHWDDPLPLRVDGKDGYTFYNGADLTLYDEDEPAKLTKLLDALDQLDYMVLSSGRLYNSIPRLPMRFPMTVLYYRYLFDGTLGFEPVATFTSYPTLGPIEFNDDSAEEQFTVYDHPKVILLRKTPAYSRTRTEALLGNVDWDNIARLKPIEVPGYKNGLLLTATERVTDTLGGTWHDLFDRDGLANRFPELTWYLLLQLVGLVALPFTVYVFRRLDDRGYLFAKPLGILALAWVSWLLTYNTPLDYTRSTIQLALLILAILSLLALLSRSLRRDLWALLTTRWRLILFSEALFLGAFLLFIVIRLGNPDLWHPYMGGEKPMDFAYLNAVIKTSSFPPYDPWFAGGYMNYYYYGQLMLATLIKLAGVVPAVAFNLCVPTLFALTVGGAWSVAYNLVAPRRRAWLYGLVGSVFVAVLGNLGQVGLILSGLREAGGGNGASDLLVGLQRVLLEGQSLNFRIEWWYWNATRVIPETINEFPWFSFLYADPHAHLIALPFTIVVLGLLVNLIRNPQPPISKAHYALHDLVEILALAFVLGALRCTNTWDWPPYLLLTLAVLSLQYWVRGRRQWGWASALRLFVAVLLAIDV